MFLTQTVFVALIVGIERLWAAPQIDLPRSRAVAGQLQEWEARDPPTGCSAEASALLACGQYSVSAHTPALLELVEGALQDAVSAGQRGGAGWSQYIMCENVWTSLAACVSQMVSLSCKVLYSQGT